jgi:hypothetical protein
MNKIDELIKQFFILPESTTYKINSDKSVTFNGSVTYIDRRIRVRTEVRHIPFKIKEIFGDFICNYAGLDNFINFPDIIHGRLSAQSNYFKKLNGISLVEKGINLRNNKLLTSIDGIKPEINEYLDVSGCNIASLSTTYEIVINGHLYCSNNHLSTANGNMEVNGDADFSRNIIISDSMTISVSGNVNLSDNPVTADDDNIREKSKW